MRELFSKRNTSVPRALKRHHAKRGASAKAEVRENAKYTADEQKQSKYAGGGFAFARLIFEKFFGFGFRPAGGSREECGAEILLVFWRGLKIQKQQN